MSDAPLAPLDDPRPGQRRYTRVAIAMHWIIALALAVQIGLGWYMGDLEDHSDQQRSFEALHISLGLTILLLTVARLAWGLARRRPPLPETMARWERYAAHAIHVLFYALLFAIPVSGWVMESIGPRPIPFWGLSWPHVPGLTFLLQGVDARDFKGSLEEIHGSPLVWSMIGLIVLHVAGAVKHQFDGSPILWRMAPWMKRPA